MLDKYLFCNCEKISQEAPIPVLKKSFYEDRLGGAANVAANINSLGGNSFLIGITGKDEAGKTIKKLLSKQEIQNNIQQFSSIDTIVKERIISLDQQVCRVDKEKFFDQELNLEEYLQISRKYKIVIFSDYAKGTLKKSKQLIHFFNKNGCKVIVDPKGDDFSKYENSFLIKPNLGEFKKIVGDCKTELDIIEKAFSLIKQLNIKFLLITMGSNGMLLVDKNKNHYKLKGKRIDTYDVTGAGDTVIATLASCLAKNIDIKEACYIANTAASLVVKEFGTSLVNLKELRFYLNTTIEDNALQSREILLKEIKIAKKNGEKLVMTNGCFDLVHRGHLEYLKEARRLGNKLIVAINDDESIKRLKGNKRPINNLSDRSLLLSSLKFVDWVLPFSEDTPELLYKAILPDVLVKGADYEGENIVGADHIIKNGGKVKLIELSKNYSSTNLIEKIKRL